MFEYVNQLRILLFFWKMFHASATAKILALNNKLPTDALSKINKLPVNNIAIKNNINNGINEKTRTFLLKKTSKLMLVL